MPSTSDPAPATRERVRRPHVLCRHGEIELGAMQVLKVGRRELAVARTGEGTYAAINNSCPHMGARMSHGRVERRWEGEAVGEHEQGEKSVFVCPWHGFEYDAESGRSVCEPQRLRAATFPVEVQDGQVVLLM